MPIGALGITLATIFIEDIRETQVWPLDTRGFFLSGAGLSLLIFGMSVAGQGFVPKPIIAAMLLSGCVSLSLYVWHARRIAHPIIDLKLMKIRTFRAAVAGGSLFRVASGSLPFLLPLMLQLGFGFDPFQSGLTTFISSAGAMAMKTTAPAILSAFGFRRVLIYDTILSAVLLAVIGLFTPSTPILVMMSVLLIGGFFRSLEFTSVNALAYADIETAAMSRATSFASVAQQLSLSIGVAVGASMLQTLRWFHTGALQIADFQWAFLMMAVILMSAVFFFIGLPENAGSELAQRTGARGDPAETKAVEAEAAPVQSVGAAPRNPLAKT